MQLYLKSAPAKPVKKLGEILANLYTDRQDADYNMDETITDEDAKDAIDNAEAFLENFPKIPPIDIGKAMANHVMASHSSPTS
jgi:uncharacterized protein (UPF0332 family)